MSYSTIFQNQVPTLQRLAEAVAPLPVRVRLTLGARITADELRLPSDVVAETFVPHAAVLAQTRLVVTHAGHGTVMAATTAGVPMVCTPMGRDQYVVSSCVERLGLGRVASMTASPGELRQTLMAALADEGVAEPSRGDARILACLAPYRRSAEASAGRMRVAARGARTSAAPMEAASAVRRTPQVPRYELRLRLGFMITPRVVGISPPGRLASMGANFADIVDART